MSFEASYSSPDQNALINALLTFCPEDPPILYMVTKERGTKSIEPKWTGTFRPTADNYDQTASWGHGITGHYISTDADFIKFRDYDAPHPTTATMLQFAALEPMQFMTCSNIFEWIIARKGDRVKHYRGRSFGDGHDLHGWFSAFRGEGHDRLASRRLLRYGPWRLIERPGDLSIIEYHDPNAEEFEALEQAIPGHQAMGLSPTGAFIHPSYRFDENTNWGTYNKTNGDLERMVVGREVPVTELRELAAIRLNQPLNVKVKRTVLVFTDETQARAHLHAAWLWGSVVRTFVNGAEVELTADYVPPPPVVLDWVKKRRDEDGF